MQKGLLSTEILRHQISCWTLLSRDHYYCFRLFPWKIFFQFSFPSRNQITPTDFLLVHNFAGLYSQAFWFWTCKEWTGRWWDSCIHSCYGHLWICRTRVCDDWYVTCDHIGANFLLPFGQFFQQSYFKLFMRVSSPILTVYSQTPSCYFLRKCLRSSVTGHLTARSDVYSFGVVLLELLTGRKSVDKTRPGKEQSLVDWARPKLNDKRKLLQLIDPRLEEQYSVRAAQKACSLAYYCLSQNPKARPLMSDVVETLEPLQSSNDPNEGSALALPNPRIHHRRFPGNSMGCRSNPSSSCSPGPVPACRVRWWA